MGKRLISAKMLDSFADYLKDDEKRPATIEKYMRDLRKFHVYAKGRQVDKQMLLEYKEFLGENYAASSANSMLAALNIFMDFAGWTDCHLKPFRIQKEAFCSEEKELSRAEYFRLVDAAGKKGDERLQMIIQTICGTGIRISELEHITAESVKRGEATVNCKGKSRKIFLVRSLQKKLAVYIKKHRIKTGPVFITRTGRPVSRCNIWKQMKSLCRTADVSPLKTFPHNLRHLFARIFYDLEKDIVKLADVLGHTSINTTRIYTITTGVEHRRKMERMKLIL